MTDFETHPIGTAKRIDALTVELANYTLAHRVACQHLDAVCEQRNVALNRTAALEAALTQITKGEGRFSIDNYEFACNTVEDMKALAKAALNPPWPASAPETQGERSDEMLALKACPVCYSHHHPDHPHFKSKQPAETKGQECVNCGAHLPEGCNGLFKTDDACLLRGTAETQAKPAVVLREYHFDRFRNGREMAQGAIVKAVSPTEAFAKAKALYRECPNDTFVLRQETQGDS